MGGISPCPVPTAMPVPCQSKQHHNTVESMKYGSIFKRLMALAVAFVLTFGILAGFAEAKVVQTNAAETSLVKV